ncbi:SDR family NAD(P)-dependent oxidoreductase [Halioxenophilus sp. WMMB6]|uniref:SDR family NAD(P)-dependent oxidoreductase n=1 Tax=Halioxenophilus sp. WMMB6 TaxID=3073815 RepID=UPI00295E87D6|nr:SDR family oxidoreductase [Halioxenophilus sp. WMMB6]
MKRLTDKVILVAGAGGIGTGLATRYAAEGAKVVLGDINLESAQSVVESIKASGGEAIAVELDGASEQSIAATVATCVETYGGINGLHLNFAFLGDCNPALGILELPLEVYDETQRINARGFYLCTRAVLPVMMDSGGGSVVYTSSAAANASTPAQVAYAMSKAAGQALMRHVATRYGGVGIRANTIAPALTLHPGIEAFVPPEMMEMAKSAAAIKSRVGNPTDIAAMAALLMSDEGSYITGQVLAIDGGTTMRS